MRCGLPLATCLFLAACFESGPLELGTRPPIGGDGDAIAAPDVETSGSDSIGDAPDATAETDATGPEIADATDASDGDTLETVADADALDTAEVEARACLVDEECAGVAQVDKCAGPIRCVDYTCRPDPAGAVVCAGDDACTDARCDPATGVCEDHNTCACDAPLSAACGVPVSWSTNGPGSLDNYAAFACGPAPASDTMRLLGLTVTGRVRVSSSGAVRALHVMRGEVCDGVSACVAGDADGLYFDAEPGARYTLSVEEGGPNLLHSVRADCDIINEVVCDDGLDDDGDGLTDCAERECDGIAGCDLPPASEVGLCGDGLDNDTDASTDCDDDDCASDGGCLESCEIQTGSVYCNYHQGFDNGSGKAQATHYACNPVPQTAREIVFHIEAGFTGTIRIGFSGSNGLALHLIEDTGRGCTPRDCTRMSTGDMLIDLVQGEVYYLAIDGPGDVVGDFDFQIDCLE